MHNCVFIYVFADDCTNRKVTCYYDSARTKQESLLLLYNLMNNHMITATTPYGYRYYIYTLIVYIYYHYIVLFDNQTICTFLQSANWKPYDFSFVFICLFIGGYVYI